MTRTFIAIFSGTSSNSNYFLIILMVLSVSLSLSYLKCDANVLPVLEGYFMNFGIRIDQNGYLK